MLSGVMSLVWDQAATSKMGNDLPKEDHPAVDSSRGEQRKHEDVAQPHTRDDVLETNLTASNYCLLCLDAAPDMLDRSLFCTSGGECAGRGDSCCLACLQGYISSTIASAYKGTVPALYCPLCPPAKEKGEGNRCLLNYSFLVALADEEPDLQVQLQRYVELASSVGTMQCADCHCRKSIYISPTEVDIARAKNQFGDHLSNVLGVVQSFDSGEMGVEGCFEQVDRVLFPHLSTLSDKEAWHSVILNVLVLIVNPERRINFQLRYLRNRPRVWSPCHNREQCFKCKTKSYHEGKTCAEVCRQYTNDVVSCPQCAVFLVKGDGCDSVQCVCGKNFSFNNLIKAQQNARQFAEDYPHDTSWICARVLCQSNDQCDYDPTICTPKNKRCADDWQKEHPVESDQALLQWWQKKHPDCTVQCSVSSLSPLQLTIKGVVRARQLYRALHASRISIAEKQIHYARTSLFDTFYPSLSCKERMLVSNGCHDSFYSLLLSKETAAMIAEAVSASLSTWRSTAAGHEIKKRAGEAQVQQFLCLFGQQPLRLYSNSQAVGVLVTVDKMNQTTNKSYYKVGDDIEVAPKHSHLEPRRGTIIACKDNGSTFDVELKTTVKIVLYNLPLGRINNNGARRTVSMLPCPPAAMSADQTHMFTAFMQHIDKYAELPPHSISDCGDDGDSAAKVDHHAAGLLPPSEPGVWQFLHVALGRMVFCPDDLYEKQGWVTPRGAPTNTTATWYHLYESVKPFLK